MASRGEDKGIVLLVLLAAALLIYAFASEAFAKHPVFIPIFWSLVGLGFIAFVYFLIKSRTFRRATFEALKKGMYFVADAFASEETKQRRRKERTDVPVPIKKQVFRRAGHMCQYPGCRERKNLQIHHIDGNPSNHHPNNLILLCPNHHGEARVLRKEQLQHWAQGKRRKRTQT